MEVFFKMPEEKYYLFEEKSFANMARLGLREAARLADVTPAQLQYWESKGYIDINDEGRYRYRFRTIQKANLIHQALEKGLSLTEAVKKATSLINNGQELIIEANYALLKKRIKEKAEEITRDFLKSEAQKQLIKSSQRQKGKKRKEKDVKEKAIFIDKDWFLEEAKVSINEASRFTGVTTRQIRSWTKKGFISSRSEDHYVYGFREVQKINLITQLKARGLSTEKAAKKAKKLL